MSVSVNFRAESGGALGTIFEENITTAPGEVTPETGPPRLIDGTNNNANPFSGATCTNALNSASIVGGWKWDGCVTAAF
jgi:hypothetical protein